MTVETADVGEIARPGSDLEPNTLDADKPVSHPFSGRRAMLLHGPADEPVEVIEKAVE